MYNNPFPPHFIPHSHNFQELNSDKFLIKHPEKKSVKAVVAVFKELSQVKICLGTLNSTKNGNKKGPEGESEAQFLSYAGNLKLIKLNTLLCHRLLECVAIKKKQQPNNRNQYLRSVLQLKPNPGPFQQSFFFLISTPEPGSIRTKELLKMVFICQKISFTAPRFSTCKVKHVKYKPYNTLESNRYQKVQ